MRYMIFFVLEVALLAQASWDTVWTRRYDGWGYKDFGYGCVVDRNGDIITVGYTFKGSTLNDALIIKYNQFGDSIWTRQYDIDQRDFLFNVAIDSQNNIIITGSSGIYGVNYDLLVMKLTESGDTVWSRKLYGGADKDWGQDIATDRNGDIIVAGVYNMQWFVGKISPQGDTVWTRSYPVGEAWGLAVDGMNNIVVVGKVSNGSDDDILVIKYTPQGDTIWSRRFDLGGSEYGRDITLNQSGEFVIGGRQDRKALAVKIDKDGNLIWWRSYVHSDDDNINRVTIDTSGNILMAGYTHINGCDILVIALDSLGNEIWYQAYGIGNYDFACGIDADGGSNFYIVGSVGDFDSTDMVTIRYQRSVWIAEERSIS
ncbi:MAG TPA: hypothetical protein EYP24_00670 [bacterium (Candidatus Stahlbacteria)]|nr:hypothetical protein [Candidatus Stahlbacteria bacterium]